MFDYMDVIGSHKDQHCELLGYPLPRVNPSYDAIFESYISKGTTAYLADHNINNKNIFPASAYIEIALSLLDYYQLNDRELFNINFLKPLNIANPVIVQTRLSTHGNDYTIEIWAKYSNRKNWKVYAIANAKKRTKKTNNQLTLLNNGQYYGAEQYYLWVKQQGLDYGYSFRGLKHVVTKGDKAKGLVKLPLKNNDSTNTIFHPVLLDSSFHVMMILLKPYLKANDIYIPVSIGSLSIYQNITHELNVLAHLKNKQGGGHYFDFDLQFLDKRSNIIAECIDIKTVLISGSSYRHK